MTDTRTPFLDRIETLLGRVDTPALSDEHRSEAEEWLRTYLQSKAEGLPETATQGRAALTLIDALVKETVEDVVEHGLVSVGGVLAQSLATDGALSETRPAGQWASLVREYLLFRESDVLEKAQEVAVERPEIQELLPHVAEGDPTAWKAWFGDYVRDLCFRREIEAANTLMALYVDARIERALQDENYEAVVGLAERALKVSAQREDPALSGIFWATKGEALVDLGRPEEALAAFEEAIDRFLDLEEEEPARYTETVTTLYHQQGLVLRDLNRMKEAIQAFDEAHERYLELEQQASGSYADEIARVYANRGTALSDLGWPEKALSAFEKALERWESLDRQLPKSYADEIARVYANRGTALSSLGRPEKALSAYEKALDRWRPLEKQAPEEYVQKITTVYVKVGRVLGEVGRSEEALAAYQEALNLLSALEEQNPERYAEDVAMVYNSQGNALTELGQPEKALAALDEALERLTPLEEQNPERYAEDVAMVYTNRSNALAELGRTEDAEAAREAAHERRRVLEERRA